jgi:serine protease Do
MVRAVERVGPGVVGIFALAPRQFGAEGEEESLQNLIPDFPLLRDRWVPRLGSGIVLDAKGFLITNHHLVENAQRIWIILSDGRQFPAERVASDPSYDLAVVRVLEEPQQLFQTAPLGNSDDLMVGEWVLAVGNPFGLYMEDPKPSVTVGVVSALHRDVRLSEGSAIYKNMIQTDAAINSGNSGGPLVNTAGEVVGVNTFIFTQGQGTLGIGFAIPINTVREVVEELLLYGHVRGVWVGIQVKELTPLIANQLGATDPVGLVVWSLERNSPAERAGIRLGDIIRAVDGKPLREPNQARRSIFGARAGDTIVFDVERGGESYRIPVSLESLPTEQGG